MNRRLVDAVVLAGMMAALLSLCASLAGRFVLDVDDCNLALAVEHFDVRMHQAHPPGYLGYVILLRAVGALLRLGLLEVPRWTARLCVLATILLAWQAARSLGADPLRARLAALLCATNPILLYYAVDGQTHAAEAAMAAALLWALAEPNPSYRRAVICGLVVAAGGSFRPTYLLLAGPAVLWAYVGHWRKLAVVAALACLGTLAWLLPTVHLSGGWSAYRSANNALVGELMSKASLLSSANDARYVGLNARDTFSWSLLALLPMAFSWSELRRERRALWLFAAMAVPSLIFYFAVLCAEAGYLAGLVAPAAVLGALCARDWRWPVPLLAALQLGFFLFAPHALLRTLMQPTVDEIVERDVRAGFLFDALHHDLSPEARVLVLSDFPDLSLLRQFPLVRPATDILFAHDRRFFPAGGDSWISYATRHGWYAAPGIVLRNQGDDAGLRADGGYEQVALDPRSSASFRAALAAQTSCQVLPESDEEARAAQRWPASCFGKQLSFYGRIFSF